MSKVLDSPDAVKGIVETDPNAKIIMCSAVGPAAECEKHRRCGLMAQREIVIKALDTILDTAALVD